MDNLYYVTAQFEEKQQIEYPVYAESAQIAADIMKERLIGIPNDIVRVAQNCTNWY